MESIFGTDSAKLSELEDLRYELEAHGIYVNPVDIEWDYEEDVPTIEGTNAWDWLDAYLEDLHASEYDYDGDGYGDDFEDFPFVDEDYSDEDVARLADGWVNEYA